MGATSNTDLSSGAPPVHRGPKRRSPLPVVLVAIGISLLVHLIAVAGAGVYLLATALASPPPAPLMVDLQPPPKPRPRPIPPPPPQGPIVDAPRTKDTNVPPDARFRSQFDTHVAHETIAPPTRMTRLAAVARATPGPDEGRAERKEKAEERRAKAAPKNETARRLADAKDPIALPEKVEHAKKDRAQKQPPKDTPKPDLLPSLTEMSQMFGGPTPDRVEDVPMGTATWLNSRQFKYATYWNAIRSATGRAWEPRVEHIMQIHDPTGTVYGHDRRVTVVHVTLDSSGRVLDAQVDKSSGLPFLDAEGVRAFRSVGQFPNPPKALVDPSGHISFDFGFILTFDAWHRRQMGG